jgi:epoxyqueuosine reductase
LRELSAVNRHQLTQWIKHRAKQSGFDACGISKAGMLTDEARLLESWLNQNRQGKMDYMANHFDKRVDPRKLVDGAKSVISLSYNYFSNMKQADEDAPKIAMYALGKDYHTVVKDKLGILLQELMAEAGQVNARCFVDSAPVLERAWAQRSGVGWVGKNTNILTKRQGSYFFLAEIILDLELDYDSPVKDYCGSCTKCIDACPTQAIYEPYKLDATKCISYFTIELKEDVLPKDYKGKFENWMFGCDICQQVCPINSQAKPNTEPAFEPTPSLLNMARDDWNKLDEDGFKKLFKNSAVKRTNFKGLKRNITFLNESRRH